MSDTTKKTTKMSVEQNTNHQTIEETLLKMEETIIQLENPEVSLEDSFQLYEQGMKLIKECSEKIDCIEKKVIILGKQGEEDE